MTSFAREISYPGQMFEDRRAAGQALGRALLHHAAHNSTVIGLPRGGVVVANEVARILNASLDVWLVRKIGAPTSPEVGIGAIAEGPAVVIDRDMTAIFGVTPKQILPIARQEIIEMSRRARRYRGAGAGPPDLRGRVAIVVDDGIATGVTMRAVIKAMRKRHPSHLVLAVPVAASDSLAQLRKEVDEVVCLHAPRNLQAVGLWYEEFRQVPDEVVMRILQRARSVS